MNKLTFEIANQDADIHGFKRLRSIVSYKLDRVVTTEYINKFYSKDLLIFLAYLGSELVGVMYLVKRDNHLYVGQLFVMPDMQHSKYHVGTELLKQVEANKEYIQQFFDSKFSISIIEPADKTSEKIYRDFGYTNTNFSGTLSKHL